MKDWWQIVTKLPAEMTLSALQTYVAQCEVERGFANQTSTEKCLLLGEEVGELFRAVRRQVGLATDPQSKIAEVGEELADILNYLFAIANRFDVDLAAAFASKEASNQARRWS
jgi:NTP pyrophosphatase (non-canonical NTP hydrolase)